MISALSFFFQYLLLQSPLPARCNHQENFCTMGSWKQHSKSSSGLHKTLKQLEYHCKQGKTTVGMMPMLKRRLIPTQPVLVQEPNGGRWSQRVRRSKVETLNHMGTKHHKVNTEEPGYNWKKLQYLPPFQCNHSSTTTSTIVQPTSVLLYAKDVLPELLCPTKELPNNNKEFQYLSWMCSGPLSVKVVKNPEIKKP